MERQIVIARTAAVAGLIVKRGFFDRTGLWLHHCTPHVLLPSACALRITETTAQWRDRRLASARIAHLVRWIGGKSKPAPLRRSEIGTCVTRGNNGPQEHCCGEPPFTSARRPRPPIDLRASAQSD